MVVFGIVVTAFVACVFAIVALLVPTRDSMPAAELGLAPRLERPPLRLVRECHEMDAREFIEAMSQPQVVGQRAPTGSGAASVREHAGIDPEKLPDAGGSCPILSLRPSVVSEGPPVGEVQGFGTFDHATTIDYEFTPTTNDSPSPSGDPGPGSDHGGGGSDGGGA